MLSLHEGPNRPENMQPVWHVCGHETHFSCFADLLKVDTMKIASFNIRRLGPSKLSDKNIVKYLIKVSLMTVQWDHIVKTPNRPKHPFPVDLLSVQYHHYAGGGGQIRQSYNQISGGAQQHWVCMNLQRFFSSSPSQQPEFNMPFLPQR